MKTTTNTNYFRRLITWDVITESEYNSLSSLSKENYKYYGSAPDGYFNQGDLRKGFEFDKLN